MKDGVDEDEEKCIKDYLEKSYDERVKRDRKRNRETKRDRKKKQLRDNQRYGEEDNKEK